MSQDLPTPDRDALVDAQFDGTLTDHQALELQDWLLASPENAVYFARRAQEHQHLRQMFSGERVSHLAGSIGSAAEDPFTLDALALLEDHHDETALVDLTERIARERRENRLHRGPSHGGRGATQKDWTPAAVAWVALAAAGLALAGWVGWSLSTSSSNAPETPILAQTYPELTPLTRPTLTPLTPAPPAAPAAKLNRSHDAAWASDTAGTPAPAPDHLGQMTPGAYTLASGAVELELEHGAVLLIEGPARFELADDNTARLVAGRLSIDTANAQPGFLIETPTAKATTISSGGRFGLAVNPRGQTAAYVYAGRMDLTQRQPVQHTGENAMGPTDPLRLTARQGAVVDRPDAPPRRHPVLAEQFALDLPALIAKPVVTGQADYLNQMPACVVMNRGPQSPRAYVVLESTGRPLQRGTAWAQSYPARPSVLTDPQGRVVDSYFVVFDPADETNQFKSVRFSMTFPGEVLTVITEDADLADSHDWYGAADTWYEHQGLGVDGLEADPGQFNPSEFSPDAIELGDDGRTIRVFMGVHNGADVFRVLVARPAGRGGVSPGESVSRLGFLSFPAATTFVRHMTYRRASTSGPILVAAVLPHHLP